MNNYEKTISDLIQDKEHSKVVQEVELEKLRGERDVVLEDLANAQKAHVDVGRKYQRTRDVILG